jgi:hypothetical protein
MYYLRVLNADAIFTTRRRIECAHLDSLPVLHDRLHTRITVR